VGRFRKAVLVAFTFMVAGALAVWGGPQADRVVAASSTDPVIAAAGDIACAPGLLPSSSSCQHAATGALTAVVGVGDGRVRFGAASPGRHLDGVGDELGPHVIGD
jgi:hypothetical protein